MSCLLQHRALEDREVLRELELLLPCLLTRSVAPEPVEQASSRFGWRRRRDHALALHSMLVANALLYLHALELLTEFRDEASGWLRSFPKDREPLAAAVLTGQFRPTLFLYASCIEGVWYQLQHKWNRLTSLPTPLLEQLIGAETYGYWSCRLLKEPPKLVAMAQALQKPVLVLGVLLGFALVAMILAPQPAGDPSTFLMAALSFPIVWGCAIGLHLMFFAIVWLLDKAFVER